MSVLIRYVQWCTRDSFEARYGPQNVTFAKISQKPSKDNFSSILISYVNFSATFTLFIEKKFDFFTPFLKEFRKYQYGYLNEPS